MNLKNNIDKIANLNKGEKLRMHWVALWKRYDRYKNDKTVWSNNYKDFIDITNIPRTIKQAPNQ